MTETDSSANTPTRSQIIENVSGNIRCAFHKGHALHNLSEENVEQIRKTMIRHAELFKEQVLALHKLYNIQRSLMHEIQQVALFQAKYYALSADAIQLQDTKASGSATKKIASELGSRPLSDYAAGNPTVLGAIHKIVPDASHTEEESAKGQNPSREGDKVVIDSAFRKTTVRRTFDLERPPEDYMDDPETETMEAGRPSEQGGLLSSEASDNLSIHLESTKQISARIEVEEKTANGMQRQLFRTEPGPLSEKNQIDKQISVKWIRGQEDGIDLPAGMELEAIVQPGQYACLPAGFQIIPGRKWSPKQESKMGLEISPWESTAVEQDEERKKDKWCVETEPGNNEKQPPWFVQASLTGTVNHESDSTKKSSCTQIPDFFQLEECNPVGSSKESFESGKKISSSPEDIKLSGTLPTIASKDVNREAQNYRGLSKTPNVLIRQPAVGASHSSVRTSQTMIETACEQIAQENAQVSIHRGTNHFSSMVSSQGYLDGAAIPASGLQLSLEGHPALDAQGFVSPAVNKDTIMGAVPYLASSAWYPQSSCFQLYQYNQQVTQVQGFQLPIQDFWKTSTHNGKGSEDGINDIPGEPASLPVCFRSSADPTQQSQEGSSSANCHAEYPQPRVAKLSPPKPHFNRPPKHVLANDDKTTVELKFTSKGQISTAIKDQNICKLNGTQAKMLINEKVSRCSNNAMEILEAKEQTEETNTSPKLELQDTNITTAKQTILDTFHSECLAVKSVPLSKERELIISPDKNAESDDTLLGSQPSDEQLQTTLWMQVKQSQPSKSSNVKGILSRITRQEILLPLLDKDDIRFKALETQNYTSKILSSKVNDKGFHGEKACKSKDSDSMENCKELYPKGSLPCHTTNGLIDEKEKNGKDSRCSRFEPLRLNETVCTLIESKSCSDGLSGKDSTSSALQRDVASGKPFEHHCVMKEVDSVVTTQNDKYHNSLVSRFVVGEQHAVEKVECLSAVVSTKNTQTDKIRFKQGEEQVTESLGDAHSTSQDLQTRQRMYAQLTCIQTSSCRQQLELQGNHSRMETVSFEEDLSEAAESPQESSTNSKGSEENSEEGTASEEACEKLAARILLSLAPPASPDMSKSMTNVHSLHQFQSSKLTDIQQPQQLGFRSMQAGQIEHGSHAVTEPTSIVWGKSIRGKRRRTQRTRSQFLL